MSQPFSLAFYVPVKEAALRRALDAELLPPAYFPDWDALDLIIDPSDWAWIEEVAPRTARSYLNNLHRSEDPRGTWLFQLDDSTGHISGCVPFWSANLPEVILGLNVLRQWLHAGSDGRRGYILVHGFAFPAMGSGGGVELSQNGSAIFGPDSQQAAHYADHAAHLFAPFTAIHDEQNHTPLRDDYPRLTQGEP